MSDTVLKDKKDQVPVLSSEDAIFDDIRPCRDDEAPQELAKIAQDESLVTGIVRLRYPKLCKWLGPVLRLFVRRYIHKQLAHIHTIQDFQLQVAKAVESMVNETTDGLTFRGFDELDSTKSYLFISNHRDISLDPAFIDFALHLKTQRTLRIAIGNNLLKMPAATALMRLNKSFIVKRSVASPRERLKEVIHLSQYMGLSLKEGHCIWIAQREGRAKDGDDRTEEAVLKMISMYGRSLKEDFATYMSKLNIVPVSITYEFDPGDLDKARELEAKARNNGVYHKGELEDIKSIVKGIKGYKGRVTIVAGKPITSGFSTPEELAQLIDDFIYQHYELFPSVLIAAHELGLAPDEVMQDITEAEKQKFLERVHAYPAELQERVLKMYAFPYLNQQAVQQGVKRHLDAKQADSGAADTSAANTSTADTSSADPEVSTAEDNAKA